MKTEKWVRCTEELALNPDRVKAWRSLDKKRLRFIAHDKEHEINLIIAKDDYNVLEEYGLSEVECLIEVPSQDRFITFYENNALIGSSYDSLECARRNIASSCTHIVKLTFDGTSFQAECVWTKESI